MCFLSLSLYICLSLLHWMSGVGDWRKFITLNVWTVVSISSQNVLMFKYLARMYAITHSISWDHESLHMCIFKKNWGKKIFWFCFILFRFHYMCWTRVFSPHFSMTWWIMWTHTYRHIINSIHRFSSFVFDFICSYHTSRTQKKNLR